MCLTSLILIVWAAEQGFMVPVGSSKTLEAWAERRCQERLASTNLVGGSFLSHPTRIRKGQWEPFGRVSGALGTLIIFFDKTTFGSKTVLSGAGHLNGLLES